MQNVSYLLSVINHFDCKNTNYQHNCLINYDNLF